MKKITVLLLALCLLLAAVPGAWASEMEETTETTEETGEILFREPGQCGEDLFWSYDNGTLTISGNGNMDDYPDGDAPWLEYKDQLQRVVISGNVTSVGEGAFTDYDRLETVDFGPAMHTIGARAFKSCDGLTGITLPSTFRRFAQESFMGCKNLTQIVCLGGMPSFNANCVWDTYATIYYPTTNPWPTEHVLQLTQAFHNRIEFRMGTPEDYVPVETTQPPAEATEPAGTEPVITEAVTVPEETRSPETTEEVTEPVPENPWAETVPETQPQPQKTRGMSGIMVGLCLVTGVLSLLLVGALIFRRRDW